MRSRFLARTAFAVLLLSAPPALADERPVVSDVLPHAVQGLWLRDGAGGFEIFERVTQVTDGGGRTARFAPCPSGAVPYEPLRAAAEALRPYGLTTDRVSAATDVYGALESLADQAVEGVRMACGTDYKLFYALSEQTLLAVEGNATTGREQVSLLRRTFPGVR